MMLHLKSLLRQVPLLRRLVHAYFRLFPGAPVPSREQCFLWQTDPAYLDLHQPLKLLEEAQYQDEVAAYLLYFHARQVLAHLGEAAEVGVYKGGSAKLLAQVFAPAGKKLHLFDTFAGMPETNLDEDALVSGIFADTSLAGVQRFLEGSDNVVFHPGIFPSTAAAVADVKFCFVHIDGDIYQTTKDAIHFFYPRMVPGGILMFHDYVQYDCPGVRKAVHEFFDAVPEPIIFTPLHQCLVVKL